MISRDFERIRTDKHVQNDNQSELDSRYNNHSNKLLDHLPIIWRVKFLMIDPSLFQTLHAHCPLSSTSTLRISSSIPFSWILGLSYIKL